MTSRRHVCIESDMVPRMNKPIAVPNFQIDRL